MDPRAKIAELVRQARGGQSQQFVADAVGRTRAWVADVERGRSLPDGADETARLASAVGLDPLQLWQLVVRARASELTGASGGDIEFWSDLAERLFDRAQPTDALIAPPRSAQQIEAFAERCAEKLFPREVRAGVALPITDVYVMLPELADAVGYHGSILLGTHPKGAQTAEEGWAECTSPGVLTCSLREDAWDRAFEGDGRARFGLAHEIGHVALHHAMLEAQPGVRLFRDAVLTAGQRLSPNSKIYTSPEWQANNFASAFLMPLSAVKAFIVPRAASMQECGAEELSAQFKVSLQAASIRLRKVLPRLLEA